MNWLRKYLLRRKQRKLLGELRWRRHTDDDILEPAVRQALDGLISGLTAAPEAKLPAALTDTAKAASVLPLSGRGTLYGLMDLIAVVGAVAFGLRGLFFQPFRIPTSSMQPTLYGIHFRQTENPANPRLGQLPRPVSSLLYGAVPARAVLASGGQLEGISLISKKWQLFDYTELSIGGQTYRLPGTQAQVLDYTGISADPLQEFAPGTVLADGWTVLGDHLFVERFSLYLAPPRRGDIFVFTTEDLKIGSAPIREYSGYYYVKRLAALPGDTVKIIGRQLLVRPAGAGEFRPVQELDARFGKIYSGQGGYHGHWDGNQYPAGTMAPLQPFAYGEEYTLPANNYLMLGDNSAFSLDSRYFGPVPRRNLVGRIWFLFYPFSRRLGAPDKPPLPVRTRTPGVQTFPVMSLQ